MKSCFIRAKLTSETEDKLTSLLGVKYEVIFKEKNGKKYLLSDDQIKDVEVIIGNPAMDILKKAESLKWVQLISSGADQYVSCGLLDPRKTILTNATGAYGHGISEYMIAGVFSLTKNLHIYRDLQREALWKDQGPIMTINGSNTLIVGYGDIGKHFAEKIHALGSNIYAVKRRRTDLPNYVNGPFSLDCLPTLLPRMDIVALCLPNTARTEGLFDYEMLSHMKNDRILVNVGRGNSVVTGDLVRALDEGLLHGAVLDVTDPEPLPADHPLWKEKNVIITPHISGGDHSRETVENRERIILENVQRYLAGERLTNLVDFSTGYMK